MNEQPASLIDLIRIAAPRAVRDQGQTTTEYAVVLGVLVVALAAVVLALESPIQSVVGEVGESVAGLLP
jgi:Flp pilus assembly pilin Flp